MPRLQRLTLPLSPAGPVSPAGPSSEECIVYRFPNRWDLFVTVLICVMAYVTAQPA